MVPNDTGSHSVTGASGCAIGVPVSRLQLHALVLAAHLVKSRGPRLDPAL